MVVQQERTGTKMSIKLMSQVWEKQVSHSEQAILLAMADYADDEGRNCYPSYDRLAWKTGYSERQVQRIIKDLCEKGILVILKPATQHQSTHYWIRLSKAKDKPPFRVDTVSTLSESRVDKCDIQGRQMRQSRVDMVSTDPSLEPSVKPPIDDDDNARKGGDGAVFKAWAENIPGTMTPILSERLHDLTDECGIPAVIHGIVASVEAGARNFNYIAKCARNHAAGKEKPVATVRGAPVQRSVNRGRAAATAYMERKGMIHERN
jgi:hypothetical protein